MLTVTKDDGLQSKYGVIQSWPKYGRSVRPFLPRQTMTFTNSAGVFPTGKQAGR